MRKNICLIAGLFLFLHLQAFAQSKKPLPIVATGKLTATEFADRGTLSLGGQFGLMKSENLLIGIDGNLMLPFIKLRDAVENHEVTVYSIYGGILLEPIMHSRRSFHVSFPVVIGGGLVGYLWDSADQGAQNDDAEADFHWAVTPGVSFNFVMSSNLRLALTYSYRFARTISLPNTSENAFDGHNIGLALRLGRFY